MHYIQSAKTSLGFQLYNKIDICSIGQEESVSHRYDKRFQEGMTQTFSPEVFWKLVESIPRQLLQFTGLDEILRYTKLLWLLVCQTRGQGKCRLISFPISDEMSKFKFCIVFKQSEGKW